jgi:Flp pilus assembly pilin Flp
MIQIGIVKGGYDMKDLLGYFRSDEFGPLAVIVAVIAYFVTITIVLL